MFRKFTSALIISILVLTACGKNDESVTKKELKVPEGYVGFSGYLWKCADENDESEGMDNPDDFCQPSKKNVSVDSSGNLVLQIKKINGIWYGARISIDSAMGYGEYSLQIQNAPGSLDHNTELRFFVLNMDDSYEEMTTQNGVKYMYDEQAGSRICYYAYSTLSKIPFEHFVENTKLNSIENLFQKLTIYDSYYSYQTINSGNREYNMNVSPNKSDDESFEFAKTSDNNTVVINFCLPWDNAPDDGKEHKIIIKKFEFKPIGKAQVATLK